jgi:hypothetical protein
VVHLPSAVAACSWLLVVIGGFPLVKIMKGHNNHKRFTEETKMEPKVSRTDDLKQIVL